MVIKLVNNVGYIMLVNNVKYNNVGYKLVNYVGYKVG